MNLNPPLTLSPRLFWTVVILYVAVRLALALMSYRGDTSPRTRERALRHFSMEAIERGLDYHRAGFGPSVVFFLLTLAVLLLFMLSGLSEALAQICHRWTGRNLFLATALYLTLVLGAAWILSLPSSYYFGYVIEHRFGFSRLTRAGWLGLEIKQAAVSMALILPLATAGYVVLRRFPVAWVWLIPLGALGVQLAATLLYPVLILPIFYKVEPLKDPDVARAITEVTEKAGVEVEALYLIDASRYSSKTNAFFTGFGRQKKIFLYDTLLAEHEPEEIGAVFAHEFGHWRHNHVFKGLILSEIAVIAACWFLYALFPLFARTAFLHVGPLHEVSALPMLLLLASIGSFLTSPIANSISRRFERQADAASLELSASPDVYVRDFKKMALSNRSNLLPHPATVFWRYSHPPVLDRIEMAEAGAQ